MTDRVKKVEPEIAYFVTHAGLARAAAAAPRRVGAGAAVGLRSGAPALCERMKGGQVRTVQQCCVLAGHVRHLLLAMLAIEIVSWVRCVTLGAGTSKATGG
ncbi:hypothetical protein Ate01nite_06010 [Actinoplanes teichomyceticus]|nr:hypothetical protein Ate01nite_06010 [Actinoplanes teichomyceticus]